MEIAYLHLVTNHIPIIGVPIALAILALGVWRKSDELKWAGFMLFAFLGVATVGVYLLGQGGEDFVEELPGVSHDAIDDHKQVATFALISVLLVAGLSLFALARYRWFRRPEPEEMPGGTTAQIFTRSIVFTTLIVALASSAILGFTGRLGGKIRHPEFHGGVQATQEAEGENGDAEGDGGEKGQRRGRNRGGR